MKRNELVATLEFVGQALPRTEPLVPIFGCFCFQDCFVYAYNDEIGIEAQCEDLKAEFAVHGKTLLDLLRCCGDEVELKLASNDLVLKSGKSVMKLPWRSKDEFLFEAPNPNVGRVFNCDENFLLGLETCLTTVATDETQKALLGVTLHNHHFYSSDGDAITKFKFAEVDDQTDVRELLPTAFCQALVKAPRNRGSKIIINADWAIADCGGGVFIYGKLIKPDKPIDFEVFINDTIQGKPTWTEVPAGLTEALRRAHIVAEPTTAPTTIEVLENRLRLHTETALGTVTDTIVLRHPDIAVDVSAQMVQRALSISEEMAILPNCTVYRLGANVMQLVANRE